MINISETIYAAWDSANGLELPEAEVGPIGESINEIKRFSTITKKYSTIVEHDNIPLPGFTLYTTNRKKWGSIEQTWLIIDPRGMMVRISSHNLDSILHVTGITEGLIQEKCVWARQDSETKMILVPVSSPDYIQAIDNTNLIMNKVSMKDVQIGDTVLLQNKLSGIYRGVASLYGQLQEHSSSLLDLTPSRFLRRQILEVSPGNYYHQSDLKILTVLKKAEVPMTRAESINEMNESISSGVFKFSNVKEMTSYRVGKIRVVSAHAIYKIQMSFQEITKDAAIVLFNVGIEDTDVGQLLLESASGNYYIIDYPYLYPQQTCTPSSFNTIKVKNDELLTTECITLASRRKSFWGIQPESTVSSLDDFTNFYKIVKHIKNTTYN